MSKELEQNIAKIEKQLAEMKAELKKSKKFEWKYPNETTYKLTQDSRIKEFKQSLLIEPSINKGLYRLSKQYAEHSLERNRVANRLEALVEQIEPDYLPKPDMLIHSIFTVKGGRYEVYSQYYDRFIGQVYMSKATATKICELLNSGEVVL